MSEIIAKVQEFGQKRNYKGLQDYIESVSADDIEQVVTTRVSRDDFSVFWNYLLQGFTDKSDSSDKRYRVVRKVIDELKEKDVSATISSGIVVRLCNELPKFKGEHLLELCSLCTEYIQQGNVSELRWRELLPEVLNVIVERECVEHNSFEITGAEYKAQFINTLCMIQWSANIVIPLAAMFIDISLSKEEHLQVVNKLGQYMEKLTPQEIPAFAYQLLRLGKHQNSRSIFLRLQNYFGARIYNHITQRHDTDSMELIEDSGNTDSIQAESTVLFHIYQSALWGHESINDYLASLKNLTKSPEFILHPFQLTALLTISTVSLHEEKTLEIIRACISRSFHEDHRKIESHWFRDMVPDFTKAETVLKQIMDVSVSERDLVVQGLVNLGFVMLSVGAALGRDTIAEKQWQLGKFILLNLMQQKRHVAQSLLQRLCNHIITGYNAGPCVDCVLSIIRRFPLVALENKRYIVELMEALLYVPEPIGNQILHAVMHLTKLSPVLRDNLILLLRKALYSRTTDTRVMAVKGFLKFLKNLKISNPAALSQLSSSSSSSSYSILTQINLTVAGHSGPSAFTNEALCLEVLGILRRCFMQQPEVRAELYDGLYDAVCMNPEIGGPVLDVLWFHFNMYYVHDEDTLPPLAFSKVTLTKDLNVTLQEPLGKLIYAIGCVATKVLEKDEDNASALRFERVLRSLCERMAKCELVHFELDDGSNLLDVLPESQQKLVVLMEIMCVYEALIGYKISSWCSTSEHYAQNVNNLFQGYFRLSQFLKNLSKPKKSEKKKKDGDKTSQQGDKKDAGTKFKPVKLPTSLLGFEVLAKTLGLLHCNVAWTTVSQANLLKTKHEIHRHVMQATIQLLQGLKHRKIVDSHVTKTHNDWCKEMGKILYEKCIARLDEFTDFDGETAVLSVECFHLLLQYVSSHNPDNLNDFLSTIVGKDKAETLNSLLTPLIETYEKLFESEGDEPSDDQDTKKLLVLEVNTLALLLSKISVESRGVLSNQILEWLKNFAGTRTLSSKPVANGFIALWFNAIMKFKSGSSLLENLINDLCHVMGTINDDTEERTQKFKLVNELSAHSFVQQITNTVKSMLDDVDWVITRLKSEHGMMTYPGEEGTESRRERLKSKERGVCCHMCLMITLLNLLCDIILPSGALSEAVLKSLAHVYNTLNSLTKYLMLRSNKINVAFQGARFEHVVKLVGKHLSPNVNRFILYIEESQKEEATSTQATKKRQQGDALKNKVLRETKLIPKVVYEMEQFGKSVIQLSNKTKVDLSKYIGQGTTRDFRIKDIKEVMEKSDENISASLNVSSNVDDSRLYDDDVTEADDAQNNTDNDDESPPKKKSKN